MQPIGYLLSRFSIRAGRQAVHFGKWAKRMPGIYAETVIGQDATAPDDPTLDENCLTELKDYRSLMPMAQMSNKPIFNLTAADGAIGAHQAGVSQARIDFQKLTSAILEKIS